jgi:putative ABC transport system ATP-binding protein
MLKLFESEIQDINSLTDEQLAVDIKDLSIELNNKKVLKNISMRIPRHLTTAMIGQSGCGKTTMLHTIAGITNPDSGTVTIDGVEITRYSESVRDRIRADKLGYVFQTFNLLPGFSAIENVLLGMTFASKKISPSRARELLEQIGLGHRLNNKPAAMSVGEQQRVAIARSLANQPALLLADEPTANVDPANQQQIVELIKSCCKNENIALLMVTHSMEVADQFDRVVKLDELNLVVSQAKAAAAKS